MNHKVQSFIINYRMLPTILFQRNELFSSFQKKVRKFLGRFIFTNLFIYFASSKEIIEKSILVYAKKNLIILRIISRELIIISLA